MLDLSAIYALDPTGRLSPAQIFATLPEKTQNQFQKMMTPRIMAGLQKTWQWWARPQQLPPSGEWTVWVIRSGRGFGKDLRDTTPIPTPTGWKLMGQLKSGDYVFSELGQPCKVLSVYPQGIQQLYRVTFSDGTFLDAGRDHQWLTLAHAARKAARRARNPRILPKVITTQEIKESLLYANRERNHAIPCCQPLHYSNQSLSIHPYLLGVWLGDGSSRDAEITIGDPDLIECLRKIGVTLRHSRQDTRKVSRYAINGITPKRNARTGRFEETSWLKSLGVHKNKHIPPAYLYADAEQRLALLQGLMDTDGTVSRTGHLEFSSMNKKLAFHVLELVRSLGWKPVLTEGEAHLNKKYCGQKYRITWTAYRDVPCFRLPRKVSRLIYGGAQSARTKLRYIISVEPIDQDFSTCITVDSPSALFLAGDGMIPTHNSRAGAEWVVHKANTEPGCRIALVAQTPEDYRDIMIKGVSGIEKCAHADNFPEWQPSKRLIKWPNGSEGYCYSAEAPDSLRGPNNHYAWVDEFAKFKKQKDVWDNLRFTMRAGDHPQILITTTPKPTKQLKKILTMKNVVVYTGSLYENAANLAPSFIEGIKEDYEGTRTGQQEIHGILLEDNPGALWSRERIEEQRVVQAPVMERVAIGVDPATTATEESDETGIVACGRGDDRLGYCLGDYSLKGSPHQWGMAVVTAFYQQKANVVIAEANQGGDMVKHTIHTIDPDVPVKLIHAKKNKQVRAEPVSALHQQGRIYHVGFFAKLENQLCEWVAEPNSPSPDRLDAYVYALSELMLTGPRAEFLTHEEDEEDIRETIRREGVYWPA